MFEPGRLRQKPWMVIMDFFRRHWRKITLTFGLVLITFSANATNVLQSIDTKDQNSAISLVFDTALRPSQIKVEFFKDIIQLSIRDATVYPAKIINFSGASEFKKIFAYQYTPALVRARMSVEGDAEKFKKRLKKDFLGKEIRLSLAPPSPATQDMVVQTASKAVPPMTEKEIALLEPVQKKEIETPKETKKEKKTIFTTTPKKIERNPLKTFTWLVVLVGVMLGLLLVFKLARGKGGSLKLSQWLKKATNGKLGGFEKMIDIVSTHHLGAKKSIAVIRIKDRLLLVGITDESINLIADLGDEGEHALNEDFNEILKNENPVQIPVESLGIRNRIKEKVDKLKSL